MDAELAAAYSRTKSSALSAPSRPIPPSSTPTSLLARKGEPLLWLDANTEVRQPLSYIFSSISEDGHFFTLAGHKFPTFRTVRPQTIEFLNAQEDILVDEVTSAIMGFVAKSGESVRGDEAK